MRTAFADSASAPVCGSPVRDRLQQLRHPDRRDPRRRPQCGRRAEVGKPGERLPGRDPRLGQGLDGGLADHELHLHVAAGRGRDGDCDLPLQDQPARTRREDGAPLEHDHGACGMNSRSDRGQATVLTLVFLVVLLGMAALVLDIGSWYRADRATQSTADAAALAGAQALPSSPTNANTLSLQYVTKNGGGSPSVTFSTKYLTNDTVKVNVTKPAQGIFTKLFGVRTVTVGSHASARARRMAQRRHAAPVR